MSGYTTRLCGFTAHCVSLRNCGSFLVQAVPVAIGLPNRRAILTVPLAQVQRRQQSTGYGEIQRCHLAVSSQRTTGNTRKGRFVSQFSMPSKIILRCCRTSISDRSQLTASPLPPGRLLCTHCSEGAIRSSVFGPAFASSASLVLSPAECRSFCMVHLELCVSPLKCS